jgi:alpha-D-xyloside xylohydrolase
MIRDERSFHHNLRGMLMNSRPRLISAAIAFSLFGMFPCLVAPQSVVTRQTDGILVKGPSDALRITPCGLGGLHVVANPGSAKISTPYQPWIETPCQPVPFNVTEKDGVTTLTTELFQVRISTNGEQLIFLDKKGDELLREIGEGARRYEAVTINSESLYSVSDRFRLAQHEAVYGLGQHQAGLFNYRGAVVPLAQANCDVAVPLFMSTQGYGILWNTASASSFDNRFPTQLKLSAEAAEGIDYYFFYGPELDQIIHQYRELTGHTPLFPKWAYGLFQSKDRYKTQDELLAIAGKYRSQHVPIDTIVQDYHWWTKQGSREFNSGYPDVAAAISKLHSMNVHVMLSIWPYFDEGAPILELMKKQNLLVPGTRTYDPSNTSATELYWKELGSPLFAKGFDAFWLDASEPEEDGDSDAFLRNKKLSIGNGARYTNIFPLLHTSFLYQNWRKTNQNKRVFLLTRSAFAGQQRNGAVTWSGDTQGNFWALNRQIPAGLNFALSGIPYWTTDIGGYGYPNAPDTHDPAYQEVFTRWYQYGVFNPIFRIHGRRANQENEIFSFGPVAPILIEYDKLRYRLLPYIYSVGWQVTAHDDTMMRPLVMDWRTDENIWNIGDQFMFGPALLVNPITQAGASGYVSSRSLYLPPAAADWYDFWTGQRISGGQRVEAAAPLDKIPLYVRAGSILPLGPEVQYAGEKPGDPIELRVYRGADGEFELYEDAGDNYRYEKGEYSIIKIRWNDKTNTLTFEPRVGQFPGMVTRRSFRVIWVRDDHGAGPAPADTADRVAEYSGEAISVTAP